MTRRPASLLAGILLLAVATSGCLAGDTSTFGPGDIGGTTTGVNAQGNGLPLSMSATPARGEAPAKVSFSLKASGASEGVAWSLDFGDRTLPHAGSDLPDTVEHTYRKAGVYTVNFTVLEANGGQSLATLQVVVVEARISSSSSVARTTSSTTTTSTSEPTTTGEPTTASTTSTTSVPTTTSTTASPTTTDEPTTTTSGSTTSTTGPTPDPTTSQSPTPTAAPPTSSSSSSQATTTEPATTSQSATSTDDPPA